MENASRALLIAGGVLIAVLTIALLVRSFTNISIFQKAQLSEEEQAQLIAFNEQYTKYLGQYVYGTEVRSLKNKYENDGKVDVIYDVEPPIGTGEDTTYYKCTEVEYNSETGRVEKIIFQKVTINTGT